MYRFGQIHSPSSTDDKSWSCFKILVPNLCAIIVKNKVFKSMKMLVLGMYLSRKITAAILYDKAWTPVLPKLCNCMHYVLQFSNGRGIIYCTTCVMTHVNAFRRYFIKNKDKMKLGRFGENCTNCLAE